MPLAGFFKVLSDTKRAVKAHLADDFNTPRATSAVHHLISLTQREMAKTNAVAAAAKGQASGVEAIASVSNYVTKYFGSLGFRFEV